MEVGFLAPVEGGEEFELLPSDKAGERKKEKAEVWWYRVAPMKDYVYLRLPVNVGPVVEEVAGRDDEETSDDIFRFVPAPTGTIRGAPIPNVRMNFMVFAYQPLLLLDMLKVKPVGGVRT